MSEIETPHQKAIDRIITLVRDMRDENIISRELREELETAYRRGYNDCARNIPYPEDMGR
jgi:hypothetical protein